MMAPKGAAVKTEKVFMEPGTYPKVPKTVQPDAPVGVDSQESPEAR